MDPQHWLIHFKVRSREIIQSCVDPGYLFRIHDPDFYPRISDPTTASKEEGGKICCLHRWKLFIFEQAKNKIWANSLRILVLFTQKIVTKLPKIGVRVPRSDIQNPEKKNYPGSRGQKDIGSWPDQQHQNKQRKQRSSCSRRVSSPSGRAGGTSMPRCSSSSS